MAQTGSTSCSAETLLADTSDLTRYVPKSKLRRVDHYSRMALLAAGRAIENTGQGEAAKGEVGLIVATGYGALNSTFSFLDSYIEKGDRLAAPTFFSGSVHNAAAAYISICYGITGPCLTVSQFDLSFVSALITAGSWLETGKARAVLVGTVDEWSEVTGYCMESCSVDGSCGAFGEGAAFFWVTRDGASNPKFGFFEQFSMGRDPGAWNMDQGPVFFSPSSTHTCRDSDLKKTLSNRTGTFIRTKGISPTDMGADALVAFAQSRKKGEKICCIKQGQDGMFGQVVVAATGALG